MSERDAHDEVCAVEGCGQREHGGDIGSCGKGDEGEEDVQVRKIWRDSGEIAEEGHVCG